LAATLVCLLAQLLACGATGSNGAGTPEGPDAVANGSDASGGADGFGADAAGGGDGSSGADAYRADGGSTDAGGEGGATIHPNDAGALGDGECGQFADGGYPWPNACSSANSDPWIVDHHDQIVEEHPVALLIDFVNTMTDYLGTKAAVGYDIHTVVQPLIDAHINAFGVASMYHGYNSGSAPRFKTYSVLKIVDARDSSGNGNSQLLPLNSGGTSVDYSQFATQAWTDRIAIADPSNPGTNLSICQLFEKGVINEVWGMVADPATAKFDESAETKQAYDASNKPIAGKLVCASNGQCIQRAVPCSVSTRFYDFNPTRGPGCHLHANGHAWERYITSGALPAFSKVASTFFNFDFATRFGASFNSFYDVCPYTSAVCIDWTSPAGGPFTGAMSGPSSSKTFSFSPLTTGCGNVHFPPNATTQYTCLDQGYDIPYAPSTAPAQYESVSSCEHYGLHDGAGGADTTTPYSNALAAMKYKQSLGANASQVATDCGGPQPTYIFGSMPGLGNTATASDGTPMHNWWVYEFY
jgi:hypothetical protein